MSSTWTVPQIKSLLGEMEQYAKDNNLHTDEVRATVEGPAIISLYDRDWDVRETYGEHTSTSPRVKDISLS